MGGSGRSYGSRALRKLYTAHPPGTCRLFCLETCMIEVWIRRTAVPYEQNERWRGSYGTPTRVDRCRSGTLSLVIFLVDA